MGEFIIRTQDGQSFKIKADNEHQAIEGFNIYQSRNYSGPTEKATVNGITTEVPEGMTLDLNTGAMVDTKALADKVDMGKAGLMSQPARGLPFVGEWMDEIGGYLSSSDKPYDSQEVNAEFLRQVDKKTEAAYPKTSTGLQIGGALSTLPIAGPAISATQKMPMGLQMLLGGTTAGALGTTEGYVSGLGQGRTMDLASDERQSNAKNRAIVSGVAGTVLGAAAPPIMAGAGKLYEKAADFFTTNKSLARTGLSRNAADMIKDDLISDDAVAGEGARRISQMGREGMLADAGPATAARLDQASNMSAEGANIAKKAIDKRANYQGTKLNQVFDLTLGTPQRMKQAFKDVADRTKNTRAAVFSQAFDSPINYADEAGQRVEDVFNRTPGSILRSAVQKANDQMKILGIKNRQIMADIADDGTVTFREMPNVRQAHELKRALQAIQMDGTDDLTGKMTSEAVNAKTLARELREALGDAVPSYNSAMKISADKIDEENAIKLGRKLLRRDTTREYVEEMVEDMPDVARKGVKIGLRYDLDEMLANVQHAVSDPNIDAREALTAFKATSSKAARSKIETVLGPRESKALFAELDRAGRALELKASIAQNSKTAQRAKGNQLVKDMTSSGVINSARRGELVGTPKAAWQQMVGGTPQAENARAEQIWGEVSRVLTGPRGQQAQQTLQDLLNAYKSSGINKAAGRKAGMIGGALVGMPVYNAANQLIGPKE